MADGDNKHVSFSHMFEWTENIPKIGQKGDIFRDRIFTASIVKKGKVIKFSASFSYEGKTIFFKIKAISGTELLTGYKMKEFTYSNVKEFTHGAGQHKGRILQYEMVKENGGYCFQKNGNHPRFHAIFVNLSLIHI